MISSSQVRLIGAMLVVVAGLAAVTSAGAQGFGPPQTIFGSISDSSGPVPERVPVEAYIGDTLCGEGVTGYSGDGDARVTVYAVDVHEAGQTAGCGTIEAELVRIKVGDRFAEQTTRWRAGPVQLDILFGAGATPVPIPTFTPVPPTAVPTNTSAAATAPATAEGATPTPAGTGTPSPAASATSEAQTAATPSMTVALSSVTPSATATLAGGVISSVADSPGGGDDGDLPVWGIVVAVLAGVAVVGGGVGLLMARSRGAHDSDSMSPT